MLNNSVVADERSPAENTASSLRCLQIGIRWRGQGAGGLDRVFFDLCHSLPKQGVAIHGLVVEPVEAGLSTNELIESFTTEDTGYIGRLLGARRKIDQLLATENIDVVAAHFAFHIGTALDRLHDHPLVMHFHGPWAEESAFEGESEVSVFAKRLIEKYVYRRAERLIVLSNAFRDILVREYGIAPERICVISGGVDVDRFRSRLSRIAARETLGWPTDRPILISVRRMTERMGLDRLLLAMQTIVKAQPDVLLMLGGTGHLSESLQKQSKALGLESHIRFLGFVPDALLPLAYRAADINVVPSVALEGFGLTAGEALAAGTPSMVTPIGGLPEVVEDLSTDLIFASSKPDDLAAGLVDAMSGAISLPTIETCESFASRFDLARVAAKTAAIYREVA